MLLIVNTIIVLGLIGLIGAVVLRLTSRRFAVEEDPRVARVEKCLPGANCGGCGLSGCHAFATECVRRGNLQEVRCPVSPPEVLDAIAEIIGCAPCAPAVRLTAVLKCNGNCDVRPATYAYDGVRSCALMDATGVGTSGCSYGCLGCGDCVSACAFGAIRMNPATGLPEIDADLCTACGKCVGECPRHLLELRPAGTDNRRVWVACASRDRGAVARKICSAACIGCSKCVRTCNFGAVAVTDNLSYIDPGLCTACGQCASVCPTGAILTSFTTQTAASK